MMVISPIFFGILIAIVCLIIAGKSKKRKRDQGRQDGRAFSDEEQIDIGVCNGDCDNCPPHYGYRYGRWYYGHGHQHGCQRGGNREFPRT